MKFLSFLLSFVCIGFCYAGPQENQSKKPKHWFSQRNNVINPDLSQVPYTGSVYLLAPPNPIYIPSGEILSGMVAKFLFGLTYKDGLFTVNKSGNCIVRYSMRLFATEVTSASYVTVGVVVNGSVVHKTKFPVRLSPDNKEYAGKFNVYEKYHASLASGDTVGLKIIKTSLPWGSKLAFVPSNYFKNEVVFLFTLNSSQK